MSKVLCHLKTALIPEYVSHDVEEKKQDSNALSWLWIYQKETMVVRQVLKSHKKQLF